MISKYYKALVAFLTPLLAALILIAADPTILAALPSVGVWLTAVGVPVLSGVLVWLKRNEPTIAEAEEALSRARDRAQIK